MPGIDHHGGDALRADGFAHAGACALVRQVELAQRHDIGDAQLRPHQRIIQSRRQRRRIHHAEHGFQRRLAQDHGVHQVADDVGGIGDAAGLDDDIFGLRIAPKQRRERAQEIAFERAADAAIGEADHAVARTRDQLRVNVDRAEIVDDCRDTPSLRVRQQMVDDRGLARPQKTRHQENGDRHGISPRRRDGARGGRAALPRPAHHR
ncbi:hypothetical protein ACVWXN_010048 [Bradyrhizobium sp. i1.4.4]